MTYHSKKKLTRTTNKHNLHDMHMPSHANTLCIITFAALLIGSLRVPWSFNADIEIFCFQENIEETPAL